MKMSPVQQQTVNISEILRAARRLNPTQKKLDRNNNKHGGETMTQDQATAIEQKHNVHVDRDSKMYTHGEKDSDYGWQPVPQE